MMAFAFLESFLVAATLVLLSVILPSNWLRDGFVYKGLIAIVMATIAAIVLQRTLQGQYPALPILTLIWFTPLAWTVVFIILAQRKPRFQSILQDIAERISIMLFIYIPIGLLSLVVVAWMNL